MSAVPKLLSAELDGIEAECIEVEADINVGLHSFNIVGLADKAVSEAKERVNSALKHCGVKPPTKENRKITINLAPADIKKAGSKFDLPIALAYLLASEQISKFSVSDKLFAGELSLDGSLRPISGVLNIAMLAKKNKISSLFIPKENSKEAALLDGVSVFPVSNLKEIILHLEGIEKISPAPKAELSAERPPGGILFSEIKGQEGAKRALVVSASGGHNILFSGPPGTGKTMLAQGLSSILPPLSYEEMIDVTRVYSAAGLTSSRPFINFRPFRSPHHSASLVSVIGGGATPKPGEVSLAHRGVLFLDELPEFHRDALESLRQPLESGVVFISRSKKALSFPARFLLVAAMNPCPCGFFGDRERECSCTAHVILKYQKRISGPLLDRIDIHLDVPRVPIEILQQKGADESENEKIQSAVKSAREIQFGRFQSTNPRIFTNSEMSAKQVNSFVPLTGKSELFLKDILERSFISPRGYYRILKVARTIADIEGDEEVRDTHLAEAFQYRMRDGG